MTLIKQIKSLQKTDISSDINSRLLDFKSFQNKPKEDWFSELCFCLLTANSKAVTAIAIQKELGYSGFVNKTQEEIKDCIKRNKHRFHNNKSKFIVEARKNIDIKEKINNIINANNSSKSARDWLVENIKGLGYKEASHFLRNVGFTDLAILDRHVLNLLVEDKKLEEKPKSLNRNKYVEIENLLQKMCDNLKISQAELDMYLWYMKTGKVLK